MGNYKKYLTKKNILIFLAILLFVLFLNNRLMFLKEGISGDSIDPAHDNKCKSFNGSIPNWMECPEMRPKQQQSTVVDSPLPVGPPKCENWTWCASEHGTCKFDGIKDILYTKAYAPWPPKPNTFKVFKNEISSVGCNNSVAGDPAYGHRKYCYYCPSYKRIGPYRDTGNRALRSGPHAYGYTSDTCSKACKDYKYFALQNNGWCSCDNDWNHVIQYGKSRCGTTGGGWCNYIYQNKGVGLAESRLPRVAQLTPPIPTTSAAIGELGVDPLPPPAPPVPTTLSISCSKCRGSTALSEKYKTGCKPGERPWDMCTDGTGTYWGVGWGDAANIYNNVYNPRSSLRRQIAKAGNCKAYSRYNPATSIGTACIKSHGEAKDQQKSTWKPSCVPVSRIRDMGGTAEALWVKRCTDLGLTKCTSATEWPIGSGGRCTKS